MNEKLDFDKLNKSIESLQNIMKKIDNIKSNLDASLKKINSAWDGEGAKTYIKKFKGLISYYESIYNEMKYIVKYLNLIKEDRKNINERLEKMLGA